MVTTHTDVAATILQIAGVSKEHDGSVIPLHSVDSGVTRHEHATIEYWGAVSIPLSLLCFPLSVAFYYRTKRS